jgi:hypothetical protein
VQRESVASIIRALRPTASRFDAEGILLGALVDHRDCTVTAEVCGLLEAASTFHATLSSYAWLHRNIEAFHELAQTFLEAVELYDEGKDFAEKARQLHLIAIRAKLLPVTGI